MKKPPRLEKEPPKQLGGQPRSRSQEQLARPPSPGTGQGSDALHQPAVGCSGRLSTLPNKTQSRSVSCSPRAWGLWVAPVHYQTGEEAGKWDPG